MIRPSYTVLVIAAMGVRGAVPNSGFIGSWLHLIVNAILYPIDYVWGWIKDNFVRPIENGFTSLWNQITDWVEGLF